MGDAPGVTGVLDRSALDAIVGLCERALPEERLVHDELDRALFGVEQPAIVRGDPAIGVVATVRALGGEGPGFVRLLAVDPDQRRRGVGAELLRAAESDLRDGGATSITAGADAPYYLFAGVPAEQTAMLCLLERAGYQRRETNFNMRIDLDDLPPDPGIAVIAGADDRDEVEAMVQADYAMWTAEVLRALDRGSLAISRDDEGAVLGFCAYDVNRTGFVGPVAVRRDRVGTGAGEPLLVATLHRMRAAGRRRVEVSWVGPIRPYAALGGRVTRTFFVFRKKLGSRG